MELRELRYFLAVAKTENITKAAENLFITQPNLSRQIRNLESELGQTLFVRGKRKLTLTDAGRMLKKRAEEIMDLYEKTHKELTAPCTEICGDILIGGGESYAVKLVADAAAAIQAEHPEVRFHFFSGATPEIEEKLDKGLIDFGILVEPSDLDKYDRIRLPFTDIWGVLTRSDNALAQKNSVAVDDLLNVPLICSRHSLEPGVISDWLGKQKENLNIVATYNLIYNASLMVEAGMGCAVGIDRLIRLKKNDALRFVPLDPKLETHLDFAWKKHQVFSEASRLFLDTLRRRIASDDSALSFAQTESDSPLSFAR